MENNTPKQAQTADTRKKNILKIAGAIFIVVVIAALIGRGAQTKKATEQAIDTGMPEGCKPGFLFSETTGKPCPKDETATPIAETAKPSAYEDAIRSYGGKLVFFGEGCKALPTAQSQKVGTRILIANNSAKQITVEVPGRTQALDSYRYFTYPLSVAGEVSVKCNGAPVATISVK